MKLGLWTGMFFRHGFTLTKTTELLKAAGFECAELCECFAAACLDAGIVPGSPQLPLALPLTQCHAPKLRKENSDAELVEKFDRLGAMLEKADIRTCVVHPLEDHARNLALLPRLAECGEAHGVRIGLENLIGRDTGQLAEYCERDPRLGVNIDSAHACANGEKTEVLIRRFGERVLGVHLSDSDGQPRDLHLIPGQGIVDWRGVVAALAEAGYHGDFHLELPAERCPEWEDTFENARRAAVAAAHFLPEPRN